MMDSEHERLWPYRDAIRLTISTFCTGMYMPDMVAELLERGKGIDRRQIRSLATSISDGALTATLWDGAELTIPLTEVEPFTRHGCGSCDDYLGESADIAVGAIGALPEHATVIARTPVGELFVQNARRFGLLETVEQVDEAALAAAKDAKDRRGAAQAFDEFRILMLDALSDPAKRSRVNKLFAGLYGAVADASREEGGRLCLVWWMLTERDLRSVNTELKQAIAEGPVLSTTPSICTAWRPASRAAM